VDAVTEQQFQLAQLAVVEAGRNGRPMPVTPGNPTPEQLERLNLLYESTRNEHRARTLRGRAR